MVRAVNGVVVVAPLSLASIRIQPRAETAAASPRLQRLPRRRRCDRPWPWRQRGSSCSWRSRAGRNSLSTLRCNTPFRGGSVTISKPGRTWRAISAWRAIGRRTMQKSTRPVSCVYMGRCSWRGRRYSGSFVSGNKGSMERHVRPGM